jgi:hypothetical protein
VELTDDELGVLAARRDAKPRERPRADGVWQNHDLCFRPTSVLP